MKALFLAVAALFAALASPASAQIAKLDIQPAIDVLNAEAIRTGQLQRYSADRAIPIMTRGIYADLANLVRAGAKVVPVPAGDERKALVKRGMERLLVLGLREEGRALPYDESMLNGFPGRVYLSLLASLPDGAGPAPAPPAGEHPLIAKLRAAGIDPDRLASALK